MKKLTKKIIEKMQKGRVRNFNNDPESFGYFLYFQEPVINIRTGQKKIWLIEYKVYMILLNDVMLKIYPC